MQTPRARIVEKLVERLASAALAASCGYAGWAALGRVTTEVSLSVACFAGALAYFLCLRFLARIDAEASFVVPDFVAPELPEMIKLEELLLTDADRLLESSPCGADEPLLLDDVLAELNPDSRVVRLFDAARMPTPGQLDARIRQHLGSPRAATAPPDASQALHEALAELRRSLR
jgi:hypothetical protein